MTLRRRLMGDRAPGTVLFCDLGPLWHGLLWVMLRVKKAKLLILKTASSGRDCGSCHKRQIPYWQLTISY